MGDRANVFIKDYGKGDKGVFLYTHWGAHALFEDVQRALAKRWRWNDHSYLARIIFCEMVKGCEGNETGFGIACSPPDGGSRVLGIDCGAGTITVGQANLTHGGFAPSGPVFTFEQFIALKDPNWETVTDLAMAARN